MTIVLASLASVSLPLVQGQGNGMSQPPVPFSAATPKIGWYGVVVPHMGTVDVPTSMEVQSERIRAINKQMMTSNDPDLLSRIVIQQTGVNAGQPDALKRFFRLIIKTKHESPNPELTLDAMALLSDEDRNEFAQAFKEGMNEAGAPGLLETYPSTVESVGNAKAFCMAHKIEGKEGPVLVRRYLCFNYDRSHHITISYRVAEAFLWEPYLQTILSSVKISKADSSPVATGERWTQPIAPQAPAQAEFSWTKWIVNILISGILTWGIGLAPPLIIRYAIVGRPLPRWIAFAIVAFFWFININLFIALGSKSKSHGALFFVALASYYILQKRSKHIRTVTPSVDVSVADDHGPLGSDSGSDSAKT